MLTELKTKLQQAMDPTVRAAELSAHLKPYDPGGAWQYAPVAERKRAETQMQRDLDTRASHALYALRSYLAERRPEVEAAISQARQAPGPEEAHAARTGRKGLGAGEYWQLFILDELRLMRYSREYDSAPPSKVLTAYRRALSDLDEQASASLIRWVENRHGQGWRGLPSVDETELAAVRELRQTIEQTQAGRVPAELTDALAELEAASGFAAQVEALGIRGLRPEAEE